MTASDFKGMAHVVVIERTDGCNRVVEFEGDDAMEDAHLFAQLASNLRANGKWTVSLYGVPHRPDLDLSPIAVKHGGGGHRQACGFTTDQLPFLPGHD
jgi:hypothetical protein